MTIRWAFFVWLWLAVSVQHGEGEGVVVVRVLREVHAVGLRPGVAAQQRVEVDAGVGVRHGCVHVGDVHAVQQVLGEEVVVHPGAAHDERLLVRAADVVAHLLEGAEELRVLVQPWPAAHD
jgi:hypothetical protein